jgi:hypothetical protein
MYALHFTLFVTHSLFCFYNYIDINSICVIKAVCAADNIFFIKIEKLTHDNKKLL